MKNLVSFMSKSELIIAFKISLGILNACLLPDA